MMIPSSTWISLREILILNKDKAMRKALILFKKLTMHDWLLDICAQMIDDFSQ